MAFGEHRDHHHQGKPEDDAGHVTGKEERGDRDTAARERVDDHDVARRNEETDGRGGNVHRGGELAVIAFALHHRGHRAADRGGRGDGRAGDGAEEHAPENIHVGESAGQPADDDFCEVDQAPGDAAAVHELTREDEKRNREQREAVEAGGHALRDHGGGRGGIERHEQRGDGGRADGKRDGHAGEEQRGEDEGEDEGFVHVSSVPRIVRRCGCRRARRRRGPARYRKR